MTEAIRSILRHAMVSVILLSLASCAQSLHQTERLTRLEQAVNYGYGEPGPAYFGPAWWPLGYYGYPGYGWFGGGPGGTGHRSTGSPTPKPSPPTNAPPQFKKK